MIVPEKCNLPAGVYYDEQGDRVYTEGISFSWDFYVSLLNHEKIKNLYIRRKEKK